MKKLLTVLLTLLMVFTLVGCNSKEDSPVVEEPQQQQEVVEPAKEEPEVVGGYVDAEDKTLTDELKDIFNKALEGLMGATYEPQELVATQVVAGTNYKFLANGTKTTNPVTKGTYYITIYKDLEGNVELLDIETIEEKQEEIKTVDSTQYSYWVVVYDQLGNELSRTTAKYGTTVKDPDGNDVVVKGNTYFNTYVNYVVEKDDEPAPAPTPASPCPNENNIYVFTKKTLGTNPGTFEVEYDIYVKDGDSFVFDQHKTDYSKQFSGQIPETFVVYHSNDGETFEECIDDNHHNIMITVELKTAIMDGGFQPVEGSFSPSNIIQCPLGSVISNKGLNTITINGTPYTFSGNMSGLIYVYWDDTANIATDVGNHMLYSSGSITEMFMYE